jgi:DNA-binding response OmpR family regulator
MIVRTPPDHPPTILIVEDDDDVRDALTRLLVAEGYLTLTAASARDAMSILRAPLAPIDVVLLDVHLPDVDGTQLCERVRELYPAAGVVVCTGEADEGEIDRLLRLDVGHVFRKPVSAEHILAGVEASLRRPVRVKS